MQTSIDALQEYNATVVLMGNEPGSDNERPPVFPQDAETVARVLLALSVALREYPRFSTPLRIILGRADVLGSVDAPSEANRDDYGLFLNVNSFSSDRMTNRIDYEKIHHEIMHILLYEYPEQGERLRNELTAINTRAGMGYHEPLAPGNKRVWQKEGFVSPHAQSNAGEDACELVRVLRNKAAYARQDDRPVIRDKLSAVERFFTDVSQNWQPPMNAQYFQGLRQRE